MYVCVLSSNSNELLNISAHERAHVCVCMCSGNNNIVNTYAYLSVYVYASVRARACEYIYMYDGAYDCPCMQLFEYLIKLTYFCTICIMRAMQSYTGVLMVN